LNAFNAINAINSKNSMNIMFKKVTIIGVGLIGGSIGLALKRKRLAKVVCGVGRRRSSINRAIKKGAIDKGFLNLEAGIKDADLIIIATPVGMIKKYIAKIAKAAKAPCIITDAGSTKSEIVSLAQKALPAHLKFVGAHPLAGSEKRGPEHSHAGLFKSSVVILTKTPKTNLSALRKVQRIWQAVGARCGVMSPARHDKIVAAISHLPHIVACALVNSAGEDALKFAASGFRDTTRIASSDAMLWRDIILTNRRPVLAALAQFQRSLRKMTAADAGKLSAELKKAKRKRDSL